MATHLWGSIVDEITAPLDAWLAEHDAEPGLALAPPTREGTGDDLAVACHRYARVFRKAPQAIAADLAEVASAHPLVAQADATNGFLNLRFDWPAVAERTLGWALTDDGAIGRSEALDRERVVVEYSSPNTNKPLHVGHLRNNMLGATAARLLAHAGAQVHRVNLINDRGIHICKSMLAYQRFGDGATPESMGLKSDHFVGHFYVVFDKAFTAEREDAGVSEADADTYFNGDSQLGAATREMLRKWEAGDDEVRALWRRMNDWCESGLDLTYARMGVGFDQVQHESETYLLGRDLVMAGHEGGVFTRAANGALVFPLERIGLEGEKAVLRADGTSMYVTQDLGTAVSRADEHAFDRMVYVVGNEQERHFQVLFGILAQLRPDLDGRLQHLSYGMVELPDGKMKSRQGTVVDADDLMDELRDRARAQGEERWPGLPEAELDHRAEAIAQAGLKFFLLKYAPRTNFVFDKENSIKPEGETGPYCQYAYARAGSILRKLGDVDADQAPDYAALDQPQAREVLTAMLRFHHEVVVAARELKPSVLTKATFDLARSFAAFYNHPECSVLRAEPAAQRARADLVRAARRVLRAGLELMGIEPLEEM